MSDRQITTNKVGGSLEKSFQSGEPSAAEAGVLVAMAGEDLVRVHGRQATFDLIQWEERRDAGGRITQGFFGAAHSTRPRPRRHIRAKIQHRQKQYRLRVVSTVLRLDDAPAHA